MVGRGQARCSVGVKGLLPGTADAVEVARRLHTTRQLSACLGTFKDLLGVFQGLLRGHCTHPGLTYLCDLIDDFAGQSQLGLLNSTLGESLASRQGEYIQQAKRQCPPQFQLTARHHPLETEKRVGDASTLGGIC